MTPNASSVLETQLSNSQPAQKTNLRTHIEGVHKHATAAQKAAAVGTGSVAVALLGPPLYSNQEAVTSAVCAMKIDLHAPLSHLLKNHTSETFLLSPQKMPTNL